VATANENNIDVARRLHARCHQFGSCRKAS
jgi:hypothetical protein